MPIQNQFFGVWKTLLVGSTFVLGQSAGRGRSMETKAMALIQGTPKNRIFDIGMTQETIDVQAPILVGGGSKIDGRNLLIQQVSNALNPAAATLPVCKQATITIDSESGAKVALQLLGDGKPIVTIADAAFLLLGDVAANFTIGAKNFGNNVPSVLLDPSVSTPTRTARHYDFRVDLGGFKYYVTEAQIKVAVGTEQLVFIPGKDLTAYASNGATPDPSSIVTGQEPWANWGTQRPWIGVTSVAISGGGKAVALLKDYNSDGDFLDNEAQYAYQLTDSGGNPDEAVNVSWLGSELTLQAPGQTITAPSNFALETWDPSVQDGQGHVVGGWVSLFHDPSDTANPTSTIVDLSHSVVTEHKLSATTRVVTVEFEFQCWVK